MGVKEGKESIEKYWKNGRMESVKRGGWVGAVDGGVEGWGKRRGERMDAKRG
jgi:hypothetical protein